MSLNTEKDDDKERMKEKYGITVGWACRVGVPLAVDKRELKTRSPESNQTDRRTITAAVHTDAPADNILRP